MRGGGSLNAPISRFLGYTLAEIIVVILIIAVIVAVTIGITKAKLDNIVSYTYYNAYSTLRSISTEMLADWDPQDPEYKQAFNHDINNLKFKFTSISDFIFSEQKLIPAAFANSNNRPSTFRENTTRPGGGSRPERNCIGRQHGSSYTRWRCCAKPAYPDSDPNNKDYCILDCWDGSRLSYSPSNPRTCPPKIECWDGSFATSEANCPPKTVTCWDGSEAPSTSACPPKIECWDGSYVTSESKCPSYVTCWDGNKKHDWSECPPCTNKPNPLPCGQGWDEHTCQLTGTAKTCPSGQHLNSGCECIVDCPSNLTACQKCDNETGVISQNPDVNRSCSEETYEWSEEQCKCIPSPRTLPRKGMNFCKLFERHANIMSGSDVCSGSVISNGTTDFSNKSPDITLRNGLRIYNMHSDAGAISMLANNTQGGVYDGVPNTNSYGYTVYVDIDGVKGDSQLWSDVYPFYITLSGKIIPGYDTSNPEQSGGDSVRHLQVSVENENYNSGKRSTKWLAKSVPFKEGACIAGYVGDGTPYCKNGTSYTQASSCTSNINSFCRVKQIQPVKFFF